MRLRHTVVHFGNNRRHLSPCNFRKSDSEIVKDFGSYFSSVFFEDEPSLCVKDILSSESSGGNACRVEVNRVSDCDVRLAFKQLKPKWSCGPDNIPPFLIKDCSSVLMDPLQHVFNIIVKTGV